MTRKIKRGEKRPEHMLSAKISPILRRDTSVISENDEKSAATRSYGISDNEQPDDVVSMPDQHTIQQQIQDLYIE